MASTAYTDFTGSIDTITARTDNVGAAVTDWKAEEARIAHGIFAAGTLTPANSFLPAKGAAATFNVIIGSGATKTDIAIVPGTDLGQGNYLVRLDEVTKTVTLSAADPTNPRIDEIYIVVQDKAYDASANALPRLGVREGTPAGSPSAPGPDAGWDAELLIATIDVPAAAADILACTLTEERVQSTLLPAVAPPPIAASKLDFTTLTDKAVTTSSFVDYGTEVITFPDPGQAVDVIAMVTCGAATLKDLVFGQIKVGISFDGGSTYTYGPVLLAGPVGPSTAEAYVPMIQQHGRSGTPTSTIKVKVQCALGATDSATFENGILTAQYVVQ